VIKRNDVKGFQFIKSAQNHIVPIVETIRNHYLKSGLVVSSQLLAISAIILLLSFGTNCYDFLTRQFIRLGVDRLIVYPVSRDPSTYSESTQPFDDFFIHKIKDRYHPFFKAITYHVQHYLLVTFPTKELKTSIFYTQSEYIKVFEYDMLYGRFISEADVFFKRPVCVLETHPKFPLYTQTPSFLGNTIQLNGVDYVVIGIIQNPNHGIQRRPRIFVPYTHLHPAMRHYNQIAFKVAQLDNLAEMKAMLTHFLLRHTQFQKTVKVFHNESLLQAYYKILKKINISILLGIIVAFIIGGIGISNIMLLSIKTRYKEIGILKALGAENRQILASFLLEAILLGLLGGMLGIVIGTTTTIALASFLSYPVRISFISIGLSFLYSFLIGLFFGYYPARFASKLNPIEILRYE